MFRLLKSRIGLSQAVPFARICGTAARVPETLHIVAEQQLCTRVLEEAQDI
jgi:hypothetical protein